MCIIVEWIYPYNGKYTSLCMKILLVKAKPSINSYKINVEQKKSQKRIHAMYIKFKEKKIIVFTDAS